MGWKLFGWFIFLIGAGILSPNYVGLSTEEVLFAGGKFFVGLVILLVGNKMIDTSKWTG